MKVCICGGTNPATNPKWLAFAEGLGERLCALDYEMVWGGNAFGVLSHIHRQYIEKEKSNTLVMPKSYEKDLLSMDTDKVVKTELVVERTHQMFTMTNVVIVVPGGIGTIYEFWTAIEGKRAGEYDIDIILFDFGGFYKHQLAHFDFINKNGFTKTGKGGAPYALDPSELFTVAKTVDEVMAALEKIKAKRKCK